MVKRGRIKKDMFEYYKVNCHVDHSRLCCNIDYDTENHPTDTLLPKKEDIYIYLEPIKLPKKKIEKKIEEDNETSPVGTNYEYENFKNTFFSNLNFE